MTQKELAEKLGVTDRAISKWENGRGMPELSLMKALCDELGISVNELLSGEKIEKVDYQEKLEENILNTIEYTSKKVERKTHVFQCIMGVVIILAVGLFALFVIDMTRIQRNEPVLFSTWGYSYTPAINIDDAAIDVAVKNYIVEMGDAATKHHDGEKTFACVRTFLLEEKEAEKRYYVYAWVVDGRYYLENGEVKQDSASSMPYVFVVEKIDDEYMVTDSRIPRDGSYYAKDMKNMFPLSVRRDMEQMQLDGSLERMILEVEEKADLYFLK
jgi:transcriptional regulator with XRE-family HTH domain